MTAITYGPYINGRHGKYTIEVLCKGWVGDELTQLTLAVDGLKFTPFIDGDIKADNTVVKSSLDVSFKVNSAIEQHYYDRFFTADATKFRVVLKEGDSVVEGDNIVWSGYVTPDSYAYSSDHNPIINITARDNFGYLDQIDFEPIGTTDTIQIAELVEEALKLITWSGEPIEWVDEYLGELDIKFSQTYIGQNQFLDKTWWEVLTSILTGYQLRYVGGNTWKIFNVGCFSESIPSEHRLEKSFGAGSFEVIPSWKTQKVEFDYGVKKELFSYEQKEDIFHDTNIEGSSVILYKNSLLNNGLVYNNYNYDNANKPTEELYNFILLPTIGDGQYIPFIDEYQSSIIIDVPPNINGAFIIKFNVANFGLIRSAFYPNLLVRSTVPIYAGHAAIAYQLSLNLTIQYITESSIYNLQSSGAYDWELGGNEHLINFILPEYSNIDINNRYAEQYVDSIINITKLPQIEDYDIKGRLIVNIKFPSITKLEMSSGIQLNTMMAIKSIKIEPVLNIDNTGLEIKGDINPNGNVKEDCELTICETPKNVGGSAILAHGLFSSDLESMSGWHRPDKKGAEGTNGVSNLAEHIARSYAHLYNAFERNGEPSGGLRVSGTVACNSHTFFNNRMLINDNKYILTSASWNLLSGKASIDLRQITPYEYQDGITYKANAVTTDGKTPLSTGGARDIITYQNTTAEGEVVKRRLTELPTENNHAGYYMLLDKFGSKTATKFPIDKIFNTISGVEQMKFDKAGGAIAGDVSVDGAMSVASGLQVGSDISSPNFAQGQLGAGFAIQKDARGKVRGEMDSITVREFMEVPELRFNRVDVVSGEQWNCVGFGLIESVDAINQIVKIKLLEGEKLSIKVDDICRGIFHDLNGIASTEDANGFNQMQGFTTAYFTPTEMLADGCSFRYELQAETTIHPSKAMKFVAYGNFVDAERQKSYYSTRSYSRYLVDVNDWNIDPNRNIIYQQGDLEGLTIKGVTMRGTGTFLSNLYMTGVAIQWTPEQLEDMKGNDAYSVSLSSYEGVVKLNASGSAIIVGEENVVSGAESVVTGTKNVVATSFALSTHIQVFKGIEELVFSLSKKKGTYAVNINAVGCDAVIARGVLYITAINDVNNAHVNIEVICEGASRFNKRYNIVAVSDGVNGTDGIDGLNGDEGPQGVQGVAGSNGAPTYTWIRYANTAIGGGISNDPTDKLYIGFAYNKDTATESNIADDYTWSKIKGDNGDQGVQGEQGIQGVPGIRGLQGLQGGQGVQGIQGVVGASGKTTYFHIKYSAVAKPTLSSQISETPNTFIGTYVDYTPTDSTDPTEYTWARLQGVQGGTGEQGIPGTNGEDGGNGETSYLHIKYSNDGGTTFTANNGETVGDYIGQYVDFIQADSTDIGDYAWSKIKGEDGITTYTWIAYSANANGNPMTQTPISTTKYIGIAVNKTTATESTNYGHYTWSLFKGAGGDKGEPGNDGADGQQGAMLRPCGIWSATRTYVNNADFRDVVVYLADGLTRHYMVKDNITTVSPGIVVTNLHYWQPANEYEFIATKALTVEQAFVDSMTVREIKTYDYTDTEGTGKNHIIINNAGAKIGDVEVNGNGSINIGDNVILKKGGISALNDLTGGFSGDAKSFIKHNFPKGQGYGAIKSITIGGDDATLTINTKINASTSSPSGDQDEGYSGYVSNIEMEAFLLKNGSFYVSLGSIVVTAPLGGGYATESMTISESMQVDAGTYEIEISYYTQEVASDRGEYDGLCSMSINAGTIGYTYLDPIMITEVGRNGMAIVSNADNYEYTIKGEDGKLTKTFKGIFDVPGVLCAGTVNKFGNVKQIGDQESSWGAKIWGVKRLSLGRYEITHGLGHTNYYMPPITPMMTGGWVKVHGAIISKTTTKVVVGMFDSGTNASPVDYEFDFMIVGQN